VPVSRRKKPGMVHADLITPFVRRRLARHSVPL